MQEENNIPPVMPIEDQIRYLDGLLASAADPLQNWRNQDGELGVGVLQQINQAGTTSTYEHLTIERLNEIISRDFSNPVPDRNTLHTYQSRPKSIIEQGKSYADALKMAAYYGPHVKVVGVQEPEVKIYSFFNSLRLIK